MGRVRDYDFRVYYNRGQGSEFREMGAGRVKGFIRGGVGFR